MFSQECKVCNSELKLITNDIFDTRFGIDSLFDVALCPSCDIVQTITFSDIGSLKTLYNNYYNYVGVSNGRYSKARSIFYSTQFYRFWMLLDGDISFHSKRGKGYLLDLGCNQGNGLCIYQMNGYEPEGLELNERAAVYSRGLGFKVFTIPLEELQPRKLYDVVVVSNVLEHSLNPKEMLGYVARALKPGGEIWMSCPNVNSWQRFFFRKYWINWHVPFHIFHFSPKVLSRLLKETGFEIIEEKQISPSLWTAQSIIARLFAKAGHPTLQMRQPFLVGPLMLMIRFLFFPLLWLGNIAGRGDCLVVSARKV